MPKVLIKETVTKEIEVPLKTIYKLIDTLSAEDKKELLNKLLTSIQRKGKFKFIPFRKVKIEDLLSDFKATDLYEEDFLRDLENGLKKSSLYR
ncbi:MAG TPA: hypothetical protein ACFYD6_14690 [Candidatus Brocadiia bacterium]|nr:hypothetical protein [Candidatus Brocadiales bacterium]